MQYQICAKTVMDTSDRNITFDAEGISNHVDIYQRATERYLRHGDDGQEMLLNTFNRIKKQGRSRKYDCILGLSGGVDSTYLCLLAKQQGLRPLVVHFDNGWNSELAVGNIQKCVQKLGFDLFTYVVDWPEFRDLQRAYFKANVVDLEVLTDHAFMAVLYQQARKFGISVVLGGMNTVTEAIMPRSWNYNKSDILNLKSIHQAHGEIPTRKLRSFPFMSPTRRRILETLLRIETVSPLNWVPYEYETVKSAIASEVGWRDYGGKHYESIFTRFYQGHILPQKFGIDKRRAHLSTLICSGQMTREKALTELTRPALDPAVLQTDLPFVLKKLGMSDDEFQAYQQTPPVAHHSYPHYVPLSQRYPLARRLRDAFKPSPSRSAPRPSKPRSDTTQETAKRAA